MVVEPGFGFRDGDATCAASTGSSARAVAYFAVVAPFVRLAPGHNALTGLSGMARHDGWDGSMEQDRDTQGEGEVTKEDVEQLQEAHGSDPKKSQDSAAELNKPTDPSLQRDPTPDASE